MRNRNISGIVLVRCKCAELIPQVFLDIQRIQNIASAHVVQSSVADIVCLIGGTSVDAFKAWIDIQELDGVDKAKTMEVSESYNAEETGSESLEVPNI